MKFFILVYRHPATKDNYLRSNYRLYCAFGGSLEAHIVRANKDFVGYKLALDVELTLWELLNALPFIPGTKKVYRW